MTVRPLFPKQTFTVQEMIGALGELVPKLPRLLRAVVGSGRIDPRLRETVLLAVAEALGCRYCRAAHTELSRVVGVDESDIGCIRRRAWTDLPPRERAAVVSALRRIGVPVDTVRASGAADAPLEEHFSPDEIGRLAALTDAVRIASLSGNTVDMLVGRILRSARPRRDSTVASEAAVAALWALGAAPAALGIATAGALRRIAG